MHLAHSLVKGVALWLTVPRPPLEACGTSGMKASFNGVPQLSTLDGWWAEGYDGPNGWAIPPAPAGHGPATAHGQPAKRPPQNEGVAPLARRQAPEVPHSSVETTTDAL